MSAITSEYAQKSLWIKALFLSFNQFFAKTKITISTNIFLATYFVHRIDGVQKPRVTTTKKIEIIILFFIAPIHK